MEKDEQLNKKCYRCFYFERYYTKGAYRFTVSDIGFCKCKKEITYKHNVCESFKKGNGVRIWKKTCERVLSEMLIDIAAIKEVYALEQENKNDVETKE